MKNNAKKDFDCVEFKRQAQARIYERIKHLSPEEEIDYFRKAAEEPEIARSMIAHPARPEGKILYDRTA